MNLENNMWINARPDIEWKDIYFGVKSCFCNYKEQSDVYASQIQSTWSITEEAFPCYSLFTGIDLVLKTMQYRAGTEILIPSIINPGIKEVISLNKCNSIPYEINLMDMSPEIESVKSLITDKTKAIYVSHMFGGRFIMDTLLDIIKKRNLLIIEDCSRLFSFQNYRGHSRADVSLFSFSRSQTATALGGAIVHIKDSSKRMWAIAINSGYSVQNTYDYLLEIIRSGCKMIFSYKLIYTWGQKICKICKLRKTYKKVTLNKFKKSLLLENIQKRPSIPLLKMMLRRITRYDYMRIVKRKLYGEKLLRILEDSYDCIGSKAIDHSYKVFPIVVNNPHEIKRKMRKLGYHVINMNDFIFIKKNNSVSKSLEERILYLPFYPEIPSEEIERMGRCLCKLSE